MGHAQALLNASCSAASKELRMAALTYPSATHVCHHVLSCCLLEVWCVWAAKAALFAQNDSKELVKLWGEDALLSWPGALEPVIHERDVHMAKTIWAAATGKWKTSIVQSCL
jgi:hypothetical protein